MAQNLQFEKSSFSHSFELPGLGILDPVQWFSNISLAAEFFFQVKS